MACFICGEEGLVPFLDLGAQPPSDAFIRKEDLGKPEARYPLVLSFCKTCALVQLTSVVPPEVLFTEYVYTTGMNNSLRANFKELVEELVSRFSLGSKDLAIDIGSNDGTLLENYTPHGVPTLGVDPSSAASIAVSKGIRTVRDFWNNETAGKIVAEYGKAKMITATNVFAHVDDLGSFMRGIQTALRENGVFVTESGYLLDMIATGGYDAVYHEHLRYYSLRPLTRLFADFGMEVFGAERVPSHSGSIRVYAARKGAEPVTPSVAQLLAEEEKTGLYRKETFLAFSTRADAHRVALAARLKRLKAEGNRIVGIAAPAKGNTLLNFCSFTTREIEYLAEKSALKVGLFAPGTHIPVVAEERLIAEQPEYALILSWNLSAELVPKLRAKGYRGAFILPFPQPHII